MRRHIVSERTACSGNGALLKYLPGLRMKLVTYRLLMLSIGCFACICAAAAAGPGAPTLYDRLGGKSGVAAITDTLIDRVSSDPVLGRSFKDSNLPRIKRLLAEQICELSGGPCRYSGDSMKEVHAGHHISEAEFYGMVDDLRRILKQQHVGIAATNELLRLLAPMKRDIVEPAQKIAPAHAAPPAT
jgi:hemoglobin